VVVRAHPCVTPHSEEQTGGILEPPHMKPGGQTDHFIAVLFLVLYQI